MGATDERCDQYEHTKGKMTPRDECMGRDYRPAPNPSLAGGGTNPRIAAEQSNMWSKATNTKRASQFQGK